MSNLNKSGVKGNPSDAQINLFTYQERRKACEALDKIGQSVKNEQTQCRSLDTLSYLPKNDCSTLPQSAASDFSLLDFANKRSRKKNVALYLNIPLSLYLKKERPNSPIRKGVNYSVFACSSSICHSAENGTISTGKYCKQKWCPVCESIRMCQSAEALKWAIVKEVEQTSDAPYLVTLTLQNCLANKEDYERLLEFMRKSVLLPILALARKKKQQGILKLRGYYSVETTYNPSCYFKNGPYAGTRRASFHPHFHFLVFGKEEANWLKQEWVKRIKKLADDFTGIDGASNWLINEKSCQDVQEVDYSTDAKLLEMTKYSVKGTFKKYDEDSCRYIEEVYPARVRADLYEAHHKKRLFNCFGTFSLTMPEDENLDETMLESKVNVPNNTGHDVTFLWNYATKSYVPMFDKVVYSSIHLTENCDKYIMYRFGLNNSKASHIEGNRGKDDLFNAQTDTKFSYSKSWFDGVFEDSDIRFSMDGELEAERRQLRFKSPKMIFAFVGVRNAPPNEKPPQSLFDYLKGIGWKTNSWRCFV